MPDGVLPALVGCPVVRIVLGDVGVDAGQSELLVVGVGDGLHDELSVGEGWLALISLGGGVDVSGEGRGQVDPIVIVVILKVRWLNGDSGQSSILCRIDHSVVGQHTQVCLGLLKLDLTDINMNSLLINQLKCQAHLCNSGCVLGHRSVVGVRIEHSMTGACRTAVGNTEEESLKLDSLID